MRSSEILLQQLVAQLVDEISSTVAQRVHDRLVAKDAELQKLRDRVALLEEKVDSLETQDVPAETGQSAKPVDGEHVRRYLTISEVAELLSIHEQTLRGYIRSGDLRALKLGGSSTTRVSQEEYVRFVEWLKQQG
jgi:excisionase family DNA binding protein